MPSLKRSPYKAEWWYSPDCGRTDVFYSEAEVREAERRAGNCDVITDEPIGPSRPTTMRVIRASGTPKRKGAA